MPLWSIWGYLYFPEFSFLPLPSCIFVLRRLRPLQHIWSRVRKVVGLGLQFAVKEVLWWFPGDLHCLCHLALFKARKIALLPRFEQGYVLSDPLLTWFAGFTYFDDSCIFLFWCIFLFIWCHTFWPGMICLCDVGTCRHSNLACCIPLGQCGQYIVIIL